MKRTLLVGAAFALAYLFGAGVARHHTPEHEDEDEETAPTAVTHPLDAPPSDVETDDTDGDTDRPALPELTPAGDLIDAAILDGALVRIYDHPSVPHEHGAIIDVAAGSVETQLRADVVEIDGAKHQADPTGTPLILENVSITYYPDEDRAAIEL